MKWLVGLFLLWITLRGRLPIYAAFAMSATPENDADKTAAPMSQLEKLFELMK